MVAFIPIGLCLTWLVLSWWRSHLREPDPLVRQARAFAVLREIAEHPRATTHVVDHPTDAVNENVRIVATPPASGQRQRRPATTARRRATHGPPIPADSRPTAAILPTIPRPALARDPENGATTIVAPLDVADTTVLATRVLEPNVPARRGRGRYARILAATAAAVAAGVIAVAALTLSDGSGRRPKPVEHAAPRPSPPATVRANTSSRPTKPPPLSLVMNPSGPTVPVKPPFILTLRATAVCRVQIQTTDVLTLCEATLLPGRAQVLNATASLLVRLGNTPGITIQVNAQPVTFQNLPQVADVHFAT